MRIDFGSIQLTKFQDFISSRESREERMFLFESVIDWYKSKREIKTELISANERIETEMSILKDKLTGLDDLLKISNRIDFEIKKFGKLGQENQLETHVNKLKTGRIVSVITALKSFRNFLLNAKTNSDEEREISIFEGKIVLYISLFMGFSSMGLFILNRNLLSLFSGILFIIFNLILFSFINKARYDENNSIKGLKLGLSKITDNASYDQLIQRLNKNHEEFFVNAAWVNALKKEKENINEIIQSRLSGYDLDKVQSLIKEKEDMITVNEKMIGDTAFSTITSEEYLDVRRENDILKIEQMDNSQEIKFEIVQVDNIDKITDPMLVARVRDFFNFLSNSIKVVIT